jgi:hypothetical protein
MLKPKDKGQEAPVESKKKPYSRPHLQNYGDLQEITRGALSSGSHQDMGNSQHHTTH